MIQNQNKIGKWFNYGKNRLIGQLTLSMENNLSVALTIFDLYVNYDKIITMEEFINQIEKKQKLRMLLELQKVYLKATNIYLCFLQVYKSIEYKGR